MDFEEEIGGPRPCVMSRREDASDLSRRPFAIAARRRNAAFVQRRRDGSPRRCAARLYLFDHRLEGESDLDVAFACTGAIAHCVCDSSKNLDIIIDFIKAGAAIFRAFEESEGSA
jgi:hypothetical protein